MKHLLKGFNDDSGSNRYDFDILPGTEFLERSPKGTRTPA